jgi:hypothetical protein
MAFTESSRNDGIPSSIENVPENTQHDYRNRSPVGVEGGRAGTYPMKAITFERDAGPIRVSLCSHFSTGRYATPII